MSEQKTKLNDLQEKDVTGGVQIKHDENGYYSERVCVHCGKTFRCDEHEYMGKKTPRRAAIDWYEHSTCPECRKIHPFEFRG